MPQLQKALAQKRRPNIAINQSINKSLKKKKKKKGRVLYPHTYTQVYDYIKKKTKQNQNVLRLSVKCKP